MGGVAVCLNPPGDCGDEVILRPQVLEAGMGVLTCSGYRWPQVTTSALFLWLQQRLLPAPPPALHPSPALSWLQGVGTRPHRFVTSEQERAPVGGQRDGATLTSRSWLDQTGALVRLQLSVAESRSQQPPGKGAEPRSDLSHTHSQNAFTWVCSIDIPWCCASSANYWGSRCLFYSS